MSRIGKLPIQIPSGVTVQINGALVTVKGPKGELKKEIPAKITVTVEDDKIILKRAGEDKESRSMHGLSRTLVDNMVTGVTKGFEKKLEIIGVGYRAQASGSKITLTLGFSHPVEYKSESGVTFEMDPEVKNVIIIKGINKEEVGQAAAKIRSFRPPEPYKGKGIKYIDEHVVRKAGKAAATASK